MKVIFQGEAVETQAATAGEFLAERGYDAASVLVELDGEVLAPGGDSASRELHDGAKIEVFKIVAGG